MRAGRGRRSVGVADGGTPTRSVEDARDEKKGLDGRGREGTSVCWQTLMNTCRPSVLANNRKGIPGEDGSGV